MWSITHSIEELQKIENSSEEINDLIEFSPIERSIFQFDEIYLKESNDNIESYKWIYCLENDLRDKIRTALSDEPNWIDEPGFARIKQDVEDRKQSELESKILLRDPDNLTYLTLGELKQIVMQKWQKFEDNGIFRERKYIDRILTDINKARIVLAHNSKLQKLDAEQLMINLQYYGQQNQ
jgi:hypothetical protein